VTSEILAEIIVRISYSELRPMPSTDPEGKDAILLRNYLPENTVSYTEDFDLHSRRHDFPKWIMFVDNELR